MRKSILLAAGLAVAVLAGTEANAAVKAYWDQATGKWLKYDTDSKRQVSKNYKPIKRQVISYDGPFKKNTIVVNTAERRLYYILGDGKAIDGGPDQDAAGQAGVLDTARYRSGSYCQ